jgi:hypothetical protein
MNEMTLEGLLRQGYSEYGRNIAKLLILEVSVNDAYPELIINHKVNFESKLNYIRNAYNEDLSLKANPDIKIVGYYFVENWSEFFTE